MPKNIQLAVEAENIYLVAVFLASIGLASLTALMSALAGQKLLDDAHRNWRVTHEVVVKIHTAYISFCAVLLRYPSNVDLRTWNSLLICAIAIVLFSYAFSLWKLSFHDATVIASHHTCIGKLCTIQIPRGYFFSTPFRGNVIRTIALFLLGLFACFLHFPKPDFVPGSFNPNEISEQIKKAITFETLTLYVQPDNFTRFRGEVNNFWVEDSPAEQKIECAIDRLLRVNERYSSQSELKAFAVQRTYELFDKSVLAVTREHWSLVVVDGSSEPRLMDLVITPTYNLSQENGKWRIRDNTVSYKTDRVGGCRVAH